MPYLDIAVEFSAIRSTCLKPLQPCHASLQTLSNIASNAIFPETQDSHRSQVYGLSVGYAWA